MGNGDFEWTTCKKPNFPHLADFWQQNKQANKQKTQNSLKSLDNFSMENSIYYFLDNSMSSQGS